MNHVRHHDFNSLKPVVLLDFKRCCKWLLKCTDYGQKAGTGIRRDSIIDKGVHNTHKYTNCMETLEKQNSHQNRICQGSAVCCGKWKQMSIYRGYQALTLWALCSCECAFVSTRELKDRDHNRRAHMILVPAANTRVWETESRRQGVCEKSKGIVYYYITTSCVTKETRHGMHDCL